jgi:CubicO group peptidase (beta-lactamase class C family)
MRPACLAVTLALALPVAGAAQSPASIDTARIDSLVAADMAARRLVGISVGIMQGGQVVFMRGYGTANRAAGLPVDTLTRFAIGSVTKQFTCAIILQLAAESRLSIDDPVAKYFPDLTRAADITLRDLMGHVAGYPDYYPLDFVDRRMLRPIRADSLISWYGRLPLDFEPGTRWSYSNTGFIMLGRIAERVTGRPLERLLRERLFQPLGMRHTAFEPARRGPANAQGYASFALSEPEPAELEASGWLAAAGGVWSTPSDLLIWDRALMEGRVVAAPYFAQMTRPRTLANGASTRYGFGLDVGLLGADTILSHGGAVSGFNASNAMVPASRSAIVILANAEANINAAALRRLTVPFHAAPTRDTTRPQAAPPPVGEPRPVPHVAGVTATEQATMLLHQLQAGQVDRAALAEEYNWWLTEAKVQGARARLGPLGEPTRAQEMSRAERGGLEVTRTRFTFGTRTLTALMYREPGGKVQQYLINEP